MWVTQFILGTLARSSSQCRCIQCSDVNIMADEEAKRKIHTAEGRLGPHNNNSSSAPTTSIVSHSLFHPSILPFKSCWELLWCRYEIHIYIVCVYRERNKYKHRRAKDIRYKLVSALRWGHGLSLSFFSKIQNDIRRKKTIYQLHLLAKSSSNTKGRAHEKKDDDWRRCALPWDQRESVEWKKNVQNIPQFFFSLISFQP